jgi:hypothetical protein
MQLEAFDVDFDDGRRDTVQTAIRVDRRHRDRNGVGCIFPKPRGVQRVLSGSAEDVQCAGPHVIADRCVDDLNALDQTIQFQVIAQCLASGGGRLERDDAAAWSAPAGEHNRKLTDARANVEHDHARLDQTLQCPEDRRLAIRLERSERRTHAYGFVPIEDPRDASTAVQRS